MKILLTPLEALEAISEGITVYYDITSGYATIKMLSDKVYEFTVYVGNKDAMVYRGSINNLTRTLTTNGMFEEGLYMGGRE